jgi:hypothetical protein
VDSSSQTVGLGIRQNPRKIGEFGTTGIDGTFSMGLKVEPVREQRDGLPAADENDE